MMLPIIIFVILVSSITAQRTIKHVNDCSDTIWISPLANNGSKPLEGRILELNSGESKNYSIPDDGWSGRFTPKKGCNDDGQGCTVGQSMAPCNKGGCSPPADTKVVFHYPPAGSSELSSYYISVVDGYSMACSITPSKTTDQCMATDCYLSVCQCPADGLEVGNLRVMSDDGQVLQCMSPCKKWTYSPPYGLGNDETVDRGVKYCCPETKVTPEQCNAGKTFDTEYVQLVHSECLTAYGFPFDQDGGFHNCPPDTSFLVTWCP